MGNPDWTAAFGGNVNFIAAEESVVANQAVTLQPGLNSFPLVLPSGVVSLKVQFLPTDTGGVNQWYRLAVYATQNGGPDPADYIWVMAPGSGPAKSQPAYVDIGTSNPYVYLYNFGSTAVSGYLNIGGWGFPAAMVRPKPNLSPDSWWIGWECSNCNVFNPSVTISRPNFQIPVEKDMLITGLDVSASAAIGGTTSCLFWETLYVGGFWRQADGPPYAIGGDAANPSGPTGSSFGASSADANVNFGPPSGHKNTLFSGIMKQSNQINGSPPGQNDRIMLRDLNIPLTVGDGLWFHAGGQTDSGSTSASLDFEMQLTVFYADLVY